MSIVGKLPPGAFARMDPSPDSAFYAAPRFVTHIDAAALDALTRFYAATLASDGALLDLMSSCMSHLPQGFTGAAVGHGMNAEELAANPQLSDFIVQNLNEDPLLPFADAAFDGAMCCAGVQYLARPDEVFADVARVLRPGAPFIVSFSNRCFPTKAVAIWRMLDGVGHADLVGHYLRDAGFQQVVSQVLRDGSVGDPLTVVAGRNR